MSLIGLALVVILVLAFTGGMYGGPHFYGAGPYYGGGGLGLLLAIIIILIVLGKL